MAKKYSYYRLKNFQDISQSKRHCRELELPILNIKSHLRYMLFFDPNLLD